MEGSALALQRKAACRVQALRDQGRTRARIVEYAQRGPGQGIGVEGGHQCVGIRLQVVAVAHAVGHDDRAPQRHGLQGRQVEAFGRVWQGNDHGCVFQGSEVVVPRHACRRKRDVLHAVPPQPVGDSRTEFGLLDRINEDRALSQDIVWAARRQ